MNTSSEKPVGHTPQLTSSWQSTSCFETNAPAALVSMMSTLPDKVFIEAGPEERYKVDKATSVVRVRIDGGDYIVKHYKPRSIWHTVKRALRQSRARRCWHMARQFEQAGIGTGKRIGFIEQRWGPLRGDSYYICEHIAGNVCMDWLPRQDHALWERFSTQVQTVFLALDAHGLVHGDMKASNLIWSDDKLFLVDLDAACRPRTSYGLRYLARRDRERFMKNWREVPGLLILLQQRPGET